MLFAKLPEPNAPTVSALPWGQETIVVHDIALSASYARHTAPLSLKSALRGRERYNIHGFDEWVEPGDVLVVNDGQEYESGIEADDPVETLCIFFSVADVQEAMRSLNVVSAMDLETPAVLEFAAIKRRMIQPMSDLLASIKRARYAPRIVRDDLAIRLASALIEAEAPRWRLADQLGAVRAGTRRELYRRCEVARAYLQAHFSEDVRLTDVASAAGLSRAHFLRTYKSCFGETPIQTMRKVRLTLAAELIAKRVHSVSETALAVGYSDFSAFARAFKREFGLSPTAFARK
jgi:AraC-like DNA-binding protein